MSIEEINSSKVRLGALFKSVACVLVIFIIIIFSIYIINTPIQVQARVDPQISFIQNLNSTESFVSNYVGISLSPQPPIADAASKGLYFNSPKNEGLFEMTNFEASTPISNTMVVTVYNGTSDKVVSSQLVTDAFIQSAGGYTSFESTFLTGSVSISTFAPNMTILSSLIPINPLYSSSLFNYYSPIVLNVSSETSIFTIEANFDSPFNGGSITMIPTSNTGAIMSLYYYNYTFKQNEFQSLNLNRDEVVITGLSNLSFDLFSKSINLSIPEDVINGLVFRSNFPTFTTAVISGINLSAESGSTVHMLKHANIILNSSGAIKLSSPHELAHYPYEFSYSLSGTDSTVYNEGVSLFNITEYKVNEQFRLVSSIIGGSILGLTPGIAVWIYRKSK